MTGGPGFRGVRAVATTATLLFVAVVVAASVPGGAAAAPTGTVDSCTTIGTSGTYELTEDVTATSAESCIVVTASDVTVDGNGYAVQGYDNNTFHDSGYPEYVNGSTAINVTGSQGDHAENVTVRNLTVRDGNVGVSGHYAHDLTLEDVTVESTDTEAITTYRTNGTVALHDVTVTDSATWVTTRDGTQYDGGDYIAFDSDPAVDIGETGPTSNDDLHVKAVSISNLTVSDSGHVDGGTGDDGSVSVYAAGPVTVSDSVVERAAGGGMTLETVPLDWGGLDVTVENVTVRDFHRQSNETDARPPETPGIHVDAEGDASVRNATVTDGNEAGSGFYVSGGGYTVFTNNTVRDVDVEADEDAAVQVSSGGASTTVRDILVRNTGNSSGLEAYGSSGVTVHDVAVYGTADQWGWGATIDSGHDTTVRNVSVTDSGDGGLLLGAAESLDARNVSVRDVRFQEDGNHDPFENGEGLVVEGHSGTVRDVTVVDTAGGVRVVENNDDSPAFSSRLSLEGLTVGNTSHHGIDVRGDHVGLDDVTVANTSGAGVVKRPEEAYDDMDVVGDFLVRNLTVEDAGTVGVAARMYEDWNSGRNDNVTLTNVDVIDSGEAGVEFYKVSTATLDDVSVVNAGGADLNLTAAETSLDHATLSGTRLEGDAKNVTVELIAQGDARSLPAGTSGTGAFLEASDTWQDGHLDVTVHYADGDVPGSVDESTLQFWRDDGTRWSAVGGTVDPAANTVSTNLTYVSTFALLGTDGTPSPAPDFTVDVSGTDDPVWEHVPLTVTADVTNERGSQDTQTIELLDFDGNVVDSRSVTVDAGETASVDLEWTMQNTSAGTRELAVRSGHGWDTADVEMDPIAGDEILGCAVVTEPGSYELARNLSTGGEGPCVVVQSSDVTIDGHGHEITGPAGADSDDRGTAVVVDGDGEAVENVTVRNLTVEDTTSVVDLEAEAAPLSNVTVQNVTAPGVASGIDASGEFDGLAVRDSTVTIADESWGDGITVESDSDVRNVSVSNVTVLNAGGAETRGVEVELGEDATLDGLAVSGATIHTSDEPIAVTGPISDHVGEDSVVRNVTVTDSDLNSATDPAIAVEYANPSTVLESLRIEDNVVRADDNDPGVELSGDADWTKTRAVVINGNDIASVEDGVYANLEYSYEELHGFEVSNNTVSADGDAVYIDATDGRDQPTVRDVDVSNNTLSAAETGIHVGVGGEGSTADGVTVADNDVTGGEVGIDVRFESTRSARYDATVTGNDVTGFTTTGVAVEAQADPGAALELSENALTNAGTAATGIAIQTTSKNSSGNGTLGVTRNSIHTGGDGIVINEDDPGDGPVDALEITYNVLNATDYGVRNYNTASDGQGRAWVTATNNYWGAAGGPGSAGPDADPVTGALADGSGANVSEGGDAGVANVHFDPVLPSATPSVFFVAAESTDTPVTAGRPLSVEVAVENAGDESVTRTVSLSTNGTERDSTDVSLDAGESTTVTLTWDTAFGDEGDYTATVESGNDSASVPVSVEPSAGEFSVTLDSTNGPVAEGETFAVNATVENTGSLRGEQPVTLSVDGTERNATSTTLDAGESTDVTFAWQTGPGDAGEHTVAVTTRNDSATTTVTVQQRYATGYGVDRMFQPMGAHSTFQDVVATSDGGFVMVGTTETGEFQASTNATVVKVDANGNTEWTRSIDSAVDESFAGVAQTDDGDVVAVGRRAPYANQTAWAVRFDPDGTMQWNRTYAASAEDPGFTDVEADGDGGVAVVGHRETDGDGRFDYESGWLLEVNESGAVEWERTLAGTSNDDELVSLDRTSDGGYVAVGRCQSCSSGQSGLDTSWIVRLSGDGSTEWNRTVGDSTQAGSFEAVRQTDDGGYVVVGSEVRSPRGEREDGWVVRFDDAGIQQWERTHFRPEGSYSYEQWNDVRELPNGDFLLVGRTDVDSVSDDDGWLMRVDERGYERTNWTVPADGDDQFTALTATPNGEEFGVVGESRARTDDYAGWLLEVDLDVPVAADVSVTGVETNAPVAAGSRLNVTATVENTGGQEVTRTVTLTTDGDQRDSEDVTLAGGESSDVTLAWTTATDDDGSYTASVSVGDSTASESVTVTAVTGTVSGTVTDAENGSVVGNATVRLRDAMDSTVVPATATTGSDGRYSVAVPVGDYDVRVDGAGYVPGTERVTVTENATTTADLALSPVDDRGGRNETEGGNGTAGDPAVIASSVSHVGGAQPDMAAVGVQAVAQGEQIAFRLVNETVAFESSGAREHLTDLGGLGADATTAFEVELRVANHTPRMLLGAGNVTDWSVDPNDDDTRNLTVRVRPVSVQRIVDCEEYGLQGCIPDPESWPSGSNDTATLHVDAAVQVSATRLGDTDTGSAEALDGTVLTTDAQVFGSPQYTPPGGPEPAGLSLRVAGPHYTTSGDVNQGTYRATLPQSLLDEWNVSGPAELAATYRGDPVAFDAASVADGIRMSLDLQYSAGRVVISPVADDGVTDETAPVVESFTVGGSDALDETPVYVNQSTASVAATYSDAGTGVDADAVELTVDGATQSLASVNVSALDAEVALSDGTYAVGLRVVDNSSNVRRLNTTVVVDTDAPAVAVDPARTDRVSERRPVDIEVDSDDVNPGTTWVRVANASTGEEVASWNVTGDLVGGPAAVTWNATDGDGDPVPTGDYDVEVRSVDAAGNVNATNTTVAVDNAAPTVAVTAIGDDADAASPPAGRTVYTNGTVSVAVAADGTPGDVADVTVVLEAAFANYEHELDATHDGGDNWTATGDLSGLPDDGRYGVTTVATDAAGNRNETTSTAVVRLERESPRLAATVSQSNATTGRVNVTTRGSLEGAPTIDVEKPDGTTETATVVDTGDGYWTANFGLTEAGGQYNVTATGTDLAGNVGTSTATTVVQTVETENNTATVVLDPSGMFVTVSTDRDVNDTVVVTGSDAPLAPLARGETGAGFLDAELGDYIAGNLSSAVVGIPVDEGTLPPGVTVDDVEIRYYNETENDWERRQTSVEERTVAGETRDYWVTTVTHFSTYGAVTDDDTAPSLDDARPQGDLSAGTTNATVRFEYSDAVSGVNASAVTLSFDGTDVTGDRAATVTGQYATFDATGLSSGTYTSNVTVEDEAGNADTFTTSFTVPTDDGDKGDDGEGSDDGGETGDSDPDDGRSDDGSESDDSTDGGGSVGPIDSGGGTDADAPAELTTSTSSLGDAGVAVEIRNARRDEAASIPLDGVRAGSVTVQRLEVSVTSDLDEVGFEVRPSSGPPSTVPALDGAHAVGYLRVGDSLAAGTVASARFHFDVPRSSLPAGASLDDVTLYRYEESGWNPLETSRDGTAFEAVTPGLSAFAIGVETGPEASLAVTDADLSTVAAAPGDSVEVTANVTNAGDAAGEVGLSLDVDGDAVQSKTVSVGAGRTASVTFVHTFDDAGTYALTVDNETAGTVTVSRTGTSTATPTEGATTTGVSDPTSATTGTPPSTTETAASTTTTAATTGRQPSSTGSTGSPGGVPGFGVGVAVLALVAAAVAAVHRRV